MNRLAYDLKTTVLLAGCFARNQDVVKSSTLTCSLTFSHVALKKFFCIYMVVSLDFPPRLMNELAFETPLFDQLESL